MRIDNYNIGKNHPPFIIAELSANHNGSLERALRTIDAAKSCGADAIKLQTYTADTITIDCDLPDFMINGGLWDGYRLYDLYKWAETPYEWHNAMFAYARSIGLTVFSTPFDESAVDLLESLETPAYKIASFELVDLPLIRYVASKGKPIIMSTGMANEQEIQEALDAAYEVGARHIVLLHCISSYPAPMDQANLRRIHALSSRFGIEVGLSDHTMGTTASVAAVALGASVIEKHFTLSRADKGPDSEFSLEPQEFKQLCLDTKAAWQSLGTGQLNIQEVEKPNLQFRRSVYFMNDLPAGHIIGPNDIRRIRPGLGVSPKYYDDLIGRTLKESVRRGTAVSFEIII